MVRPIEDKGLLSQKLEEDRQELAVQIDGLKEDYNPVRKVAASIRAGILGLDYRHGACWCSIVAPARATKRNSPFD